MENNLFYRLKKDLPLIQENVSLANLTTYKIGGEAKYFFRAKNEKDLALAVKKAKELKMPVFILGGGSNLLVSDKGFDGLVIKIDILDMKFDGNKVFVAAGVSLAMLAQEASKKGLSGMEWAVGIPAATIGGAVYGHAMAFGEKISDVIKSVRVLDSASLEFKDFSKQECQFSLKNSIFKRNKNLIIISVEMEFEEKNPEEIERTVKSNVAYRASRHPMSFPSAGSTFVNPEVKIEDKKLLEEFPELENYNQKGVIPAGYLISKCGLVGKTIGKAQFSEQHANFIINLGGAKAEDVLALIDLAKKEVKKTFGIELEQEVQMVGF